MSLVYLIYTWQWPSGSYFVRKMSSLLVVKAARSRGPKVGTRGRSSLRPDSGLQPRAAILVTSGHGESPSGPERGVLVPSRPGPRTLASRRARGRKCCDEIFSMVTTIYYCCFVFPPTSNFNHPKIFDPNVCLGWGVNREICRKICCCLYLTKSNRKNPKMVKWPMLIIPFLICRDWQ